MKKKRVIVICGPTASGKTDKAIDLAQHFSTQIVNADSRQCFRELNIGVAKPDTMQLSAVEHYFVNSHSIQEHVTAATFEAYALSKVQEIFIQNDTAIVCGGTGLYINAFCNGLDAIPAIKETILQEIEIGFQNNGIEYLHQQIQEIDPLFFEKGEIKNPMRLRRALAVKKQTGKSIIEWQSKNTVERDFDVFHFAIDTPREQLYQRINNRVEVMMDMGLLEEVKQLVPFQNNKNLHTVGYSELFSFLKNEMSLQEAIEKIKQNTRHYAKRQITWFKKFNDVKWLPFQEFQKELLKNI
jgi:tRNA dimethylallyltransferase